MPMKSTLEFQYSVFCIMRDFKCVSALLCETNERCSYPSTEQYGNSVLWTPTVILSQSNEYWFAQKADKCYIREEASLS